MAVKPATAPAITNDQITAGPATGTACDSTMKMPVPIVAPTPNSVSWNSPIVRASSPFSVSAHVSSAMTLTGLVRRICSRSDGFAPPRTAVIAPPRVDACPSSDVAREQVRPGLATHHRPGPPVGREHDRDAEGPVVVVRHREAVRARRRHGEQVADARHGEADAVDEHIAALAVSAHDRDGLAAGAVQPVGYPRLEALVEQRHLEVVAHAAVDGDERDLPA